ncbi:MAG: M28 family peptidase [Thermodesulfobacteriota bacterium]
MDKLRPDQGLAEQVLKETGRIIDACGPRITGTEACRKSAKMLADRLGKVCDKVFTEEFSIHPASFLSFMKYYAVSYAVSLVLLFMDGALVYTAAVLLAAGALLSLSQFVLYKEFFDFAHPKKSAVNVYGTIEPEGPVRQQIIVSGHHDSAFEFNFLASRFQKYYAIRITAGVLCYLVLCGAVIVWAYLQAKTGHPPAFSRAVVWLGLAGSLVVLPFYRFVSDKESPGAGDNMVASVMAAELAGLFTKDGGGALRHTRIIAASFDAEECGLRGSRDFARRHKLELHAIPTYVLNIDSIYELAEIKLLISDLNGFTRLSKTMARQCRDTAHALGYGARLQPMVFGGGATDAAEFAAIGVPATTLLAMKTTHIREGLAYHTCKDTVDSIEPPAVAACLDIAYHYILLKDRAVRD